MKKAPLYSRSRPPARVADAAAHTEAAPGPLPAPRSRLGAWVVRHERRLWASAVLLLLVAGLALNGSVAPHKPALTIEQIDAAIRQSIEDKPLASPEARAYEAILPSVVRVVGLLTDGDDGKDDDDAHHGAVERGVGTGVVIIDNGTILTNLHVIHGARRIKVTFMDGSDSEAVVLSTQPQNDLAVLRAKKIPDDLQAATMRSTGDLLPGDHVVVSASRSASGRRCPAAWCPA